MAWPPPSNPVITVSATQEARHAATAASAAEPPSARISIPASAVARWPAATAARIDRILTAVDAGGRRGRCRIVATLVPDRSLGRSLVLPRGALGLRSR